MSRLLVALLIVICTTDRACVDAGGSFQRGFRSGGNVHANQARSGRIGHGASQSRWSADGFRFGDGGYSGYGYAPYGPYGYIDPYAYDPYQYGSFEMQDPADDPYLRARYRYDTFFPGRRGAGRAAR